MWPGRRILRTFWVDKNPLVDCSALIAGDGRNLKGTRLSRMSRANSISRAASARRASRPPTLWLKLAQRSRWKPSDLQSSGRSCRTQKNALGADDEGADRGGRKMGSGTKTGKSVVINHSCGRRQGRSDDEDKKKQNKFFFPMCFMIIGCIFNPAGKSQESLEERMQ